MRKILILAPLRHRDFALLWGGMAVSLLGDGIYFVAIAWEALRLSNTTAAISFVGIAWMLPTIAFVLLGGSLSDRFDRRRLMLLASSGQALAIGAIGVLVTLGTVRLWELLVLVALYGAADALFLPAFEAIVPTILKPGELTQASALEQFVRPLSLQLAGPAIGGILIAISGTGAAFLTDAGTFVLAALAIAAMRPPRRAAGPEQGDEAAFAGIGEALRFVRANPWLRRTLLAAALTLLLFVGPSLVLLPYVVKNVLHAGAGTLGAIRAAGGVGALVAALTIGQRGLPGWPVRAMLAGWAIQCVTLTVYALSANAWLFGAVSLIGGACGAAGNVVWGALIKTRVPNELLGRVASLDFLVSIGLVPVSLAITGPVAAALGAQATLMGGGLLAGATMLMFAVLGRSPQEVRTAPSPGALSTTPAGEGSAICSGDRAAVPVRPSRATV